MRYLVINDAGLVTNVILWDGVSPYQLDEGHRLEPIEAQSSDVWIGWKLVNGEWFPPDAERNDI